MQKCLFFIRTCTNI